MDFNVYVCNIMYINGWEARSDYCILFVKVNIFLEHFHKYI